MYIGEETVKPWARVGQVSGPVAYIPGDPHEPLGQNGGKGAADLSTNQFGMIR